MVQLDIHLEKDNVGLYFMPCAKKLQMDKRVKYIIIKLRIFRKKNLRRGKGTKTKIHK